MPVPDMGVVIPAAGRGKRMGGPLSKQYVELEGRPLLAYALKTFLDLKPRRVVVVVAPGEEELFRRVVLPSLGTAGRDVVLAPGGDERQESVFWGVKALPPDIEFICVHDGARPLVSPGLVEAVLRGCREAGAAAACVPLKDTIKKVDRQGYGVETPHREEYVAVQTPQIFRREVLVPSLERARLEGFSATDETALVEHYGERVKVVPGEAFNIKVTTPDDLVFVKAILQKRRQGDADRFGL